MNYARNKENELIYKVWGTGRETQKPTVGRIKCSYANIYLPAQSKTMKGNTGFRKVWSFNDGQMGNANILYDYPVFEKKWVVAENPFLIELPKSPITGGDETSKKKVEYNFLNPRTYHVGRLTAEALEAIRLETKGKGEIVDMLRESDGFVFYAPAEYEWSYLKPNGGGGNNGGDEPGNEKKQGKSWWLYVLLALGILNS